MPERLLAQRSGAGPERERTDCKYVRSFSSALTTPTTWGCRAQQLDSPPRVGYTLPTVKRVTIYTDGACSGNPGPGGWGAVLLYPGRRLEISGGERATTNNRMELQAAIEALRALRRPSDVDLHTDSTYVRNGITQWIASWKALGWKRRSGKRLLPVKNEDLWRTLDQLVNHTGHTVRFHWLEGHAGHPDNERADRLARDAVPRS